MNDVVNINELCAKCYKPIYKSNTTDATLCECDIPLTTDKLKEIREKCFPQTSERIASGAELYFTVTEVEQIQSETYQLGRQEVIEEIREMFLPEDVALDINFTYGYNKAISEILSKLNNLKK